MRKRYLHVGLFLLSIILILISCATASGTVIVTGEKRTPLDPSQIVLYTENPTNYTVIGIVSASSSAGWT